MVSQTGNYVKHTHIKVGTRIMDGIYNSEIVTVYFPSFCETWSTPSLIWPKRAIPRCSPLYHLVRTHAKFSYPRSSICFNKFLPRRIPRHSLSLRSISRPYHGSDIQVCDDSLVHVSVEDMFFCRGFGPRNMF